MPWAGDGKAMGNTFISTVRDGGMHELDIKWLADQSRIVIMLDGTPIQDEVIPLYAIKFVHIGFGRPTYKGSVPLRFCYEDFVFNQKL